MSHKVYVSFITIYYFRNESVMSLSGESETDNETCFCQSYSLCVVLVLPTHVRWLGWHGHPDA